MTEKDELLELIPLLACGALDADEKARAQALLERHPDVSAESYRDLDALLRHALAPAPALVRRQCPYCKDDLRSAPEVLCAKCLTPHHRECFSENRGCSLLGCHGTRSVSAQEPSLDVCPTCGEHTPSEAPFCAWCRTPLGGERAPRHARRVAAEAPRDLGRFLASCAALLVAGLSIGWFFEARQNVFMDQLLAQGQRLESQRLLKGAEAALLSIRDAQELYRKAHQPQWSGTLTVCLDPLYAGSVADLAPIMSASRFDAPGYTIHLTRGPGCVLSSNAYVPFEPAVVTSDSIVAGTIGSSSLPAVTVPLAFFTQDHFAALAIPTNEDERVRWNRLVPAAAERPAVFLDVNGTIQSIPANGATWNVTIDPTTLSLDRGRGVNTR